MSAASELADQHVRDTLAQLVVTLRDGLDVVDWLHSDKNGCGDPDEYPRCETCDWRRKAEQELWTLERRGALPGSDQQALVRRAETAERNVARLVELVDSIGPQAAELIS